MGAELWFHRADWHENPDDALKDFQAGYFAENYDLKSKLQEHWDSAKEAVAAVITDGDEYGLLEIYQEELNLLEDLNRRPIPESPKVQIEILREISKYSFQGIGNILDIEGISNERKIGMAMPLSPQEIQRYTGSERPSLSEAEKSVLAIDSDNLGRGECVCFPIYEDGSPAGWFFVGNTVD